VRRHSLLQSNLISDEVLRKLLISLLIFNGIDVPVSWYFIEVQGVATEGNPLMAIALQWGFLPFCTIKASLIGLAGFLLWRRKELAIARFGIFLCFSVYWALMWHELSLFVTSY